MVGDGGRDARANFGDAVVGERGLGKHAEAEADRADARASNEKRGVFKKLVDDSRLDGVADHEGDEKAQNDERAMAVREKGNS